MILIRAALIALALFLAVVPMPARLVEAWYSRRLYLAIQTTLTPLSNRTSISILDVAIGLLLAVLVVAFVRRVRAAGFVRALGRGLLTLLTLAAAVYLLFLAIWGLNYRRMPLDAKLEFDRSRITREGVRRLGDHAARMLNATYARAHAADQGGPAIDEAFASAQRLLGSSSLAVPAIPKRSALQLYFRMAAIDGMTDPFFLEVVVNPDALRFELPFITLHEWAHLAGYAHEAEANFVAWLACTQGNDLAKYSGWLAIFEHALASLPEADGAALRSALDPGVVEDMRASAARYARSTPVVRDSAREVYDRYLRANRVHEGIAAYSAVTRLIVGAGLESGESLRLRSQH
jgi:Protein of unknown function (DUF3810)